MSVRWVSTPLGPWPTTALLLLVACASFALPDARAHENELLTVRFLKVPGSGNASGIKGVQLLEEAPPFLPIPSAPGIKSIVLNPHERYQKMWGFGAALTDACQSNLSQMNSLQYQALMRRVFAPGMGAGFSELRVPLGGNDYSTGDYTLDDSPDGKADLEFRHYDFSKAEKLVATLKEAKRLNPDLQLMLTPWSAPAWMKSPAHLKGGTLRPEFYEAYAKYLVRSIEEFSSRGVEIDHFSILNEPYIQDANLDWNYPQMVMTTSEQLDFMSHHLVPLMEAERKAGKLHAKILLHDHNWDLASGVDELLHNGGVAAQTAGVAFHCYSGSPVDMETALAAHPNTPRLLTECTALLQNEKDTSVFTYWSKNFAIEGTRLGLGGAMGWNLCLDTRGQPRNPDSHGCPNCRGMLTVRGDGSFEENQEFLAFEQVSRFVKPGAVRIGSTDLSNEDLPNVAFENPDGSRVLVVRNDTDREAEILVRDERVGGARLRVPAAGAVSAIWRPSAP